MIEQDIVPEVVRKIDIVPGGLIEQEIALEDLITPDVVREGEKVPEVLIEREITPEVVILYGSLTQTSVEEDTFQEQVQLYTKTAKFQAKSENAPDDTFSVSSFGYHYDQQFSNDSIQTIAKDLENVSK